MNRASTSLPCSEGEENLWLPPRRLLKYQLAKVIGGSLVLFLFVGWMIIEWASVMMRLFAAMLSIITVWVTIASLVIDVRRSRGRQLRIEPGAPGAPGDLVMTTPETTTRVKLEDVSYGQWRDDTHERTGLWLYDSRDEILVHLDTNFLSSQHEAGAFLGWARRRTELPFDVKWPATKRL